MTTDELLLNVLHQACYIPNEDVIDNMCISAYEDACEYLYFRGMLLKKNDRIYVEVKDE